MIHVPNQPRSYRADAQGYVAPQGTMPEADGLLPNYLDLMQTTVAPPFFTSMEEVMNGAERNGNFIPGVIGFAEVLKRQPQLRVVENADDLDLALANNQTAIVMGLHEPPHDLSGNALIRLKRKGVHVINIANGVDNPYGSGFHNNHIGLKKAGEKLIEEMAANGMILDLSHAANQTALDALEYVRARNIDITVFASHTGVVEAYRGNPNDVNNTRNLPAEVLSAIAEANGVVGVYALTFGLGSENEEVDVFIDHLNAAKNIIGSDKLVLGTDGVYKVRDRKEWADHADFMAANLAKPTPDGRVILEPRHPDIPFSINFPGKIHKLGELMLSSGLTQAEVAAISGNNLGIFFEENLSKSS